MLARVLRGAGYNVALAGSPREAVAVAQNVDPDLVVLDLKTPDSESWEAFEQIRRMRPITPVIATTSWSNQEEQAVERGIDALMEKPLDLPLLLNLINQLLTEPEAVRTERRQRRVPMEARVAA